MASEYTIGKFISTDGKTQIAYHMWTPEGAPVCVLQISHGMCEYMGRYADFAQFLCAHGCAVCGNDHLGHGASAANDDDLGYIPRRGGSDMLVGDLYKMTQIAREKLPGIPVFLLGHSMGSFAARLYLSRYGGELDGAIIMGTGGPGNPTGLAKFLATLAGLTNGGRRRSELINKIAFGSYLKKYGKGCSPYAWISRDEKIVDKYSKDKYCSSFIFTADGFYTLFDMLGRVSDKKWASSVPQGLPVLIVSGADDPVGDYGRGVRIVYNRLLAAGLSDLSLKLYPEDRHEILNELDRSGVYADIWSWINEKSVKVK